MKKINCDYMLTLICPSCGNESKKTNFMGTLCKTCYYKNHSLLTFHAKDVFLCKGCGRIKFGSNWEPFSEDSFVDKFATSIRTLGSCEIKSCTPVFFKDRIRLDAKVKIKGNTKLQKVSVGLSPKQQFCPDCSKKLGGFFQSIIQLRGFEDTELVKDNFMKLFKKVAKEEVKDGNYLAYLEKVEDVRNGLDFYVGSKNLAMAFIRAIKEKFDVEMKYSAKLIGMVNNKKKVRNTFLVRKKEEKKEIPKEESD